MKREELKGLIRELNMYSSASQRCLDARQQILAEFDRLTTLVYADNGEEYKFLAFDLLKERDRLTEENEALMSACDAMTGDWEKAELTLLKICSAEPAWSCECLSCKEIQAHLSSKLKPCEHKYKKGIVSCKDCGEVVKEFEDYPGLPKKQKGYKKIPGLPESLEISANVLMGREGKPRDK